MNAVKAIRERDMPEEQREAILAAQEADRRRHEIDAQILVAVVTDLFEHCLESSCVLGRQEI